MTSLNLYKLENNNKISCLQNNCKYKSRNPKNIHKTIIQHYYRNHNEYYKQLKIQTKPYSKPFNQTKNIEYNKNMNTQNKETQQEQQELTQEQDKNQFKITDYISKNQNNLNTVKENLSNSNLTNSGKQEKRKYKIISDDKTFYIETKKLRIEKIETTFFE